MKEEKENENILRLVSEIDHNSFIVVDEMQVILPGFPTAKTGETTCSNQVV